MSTVEYPQKFIEKVQAEIPETKNMPGLFKGRGKDGEALGRILADASQLNWEPKMVVKAFEEGREQELKKTAKKAIRCRRLYKEFERLFFNPDAV